MKMIDTRKYLIHASFVGDGDLIRPASILDLFQDEASIHAKILGMGFKDMYYKGLLWIVNYQEINYIGRVPHHCEEVMVSTWPHERKRLDYIREYEIRDLDGNLLISGIASWFTIDLNTRKLVKDDNVNFNGDYYLDTNYPNFRRARLDLKPIGDVVKWDYRVCYTDLDHNGHMNNAKYLDVIYNKHIGFDLNKIGKIAIAFNHEIKYDDIVNMEYFKDENNNSCYIGYVDGIKCFEARFEER